MDLINDIRFDLVTAYFNDGDESTSHRKLDRDNARSLIERLEQVYAQITELHERSKAHDPIASNDPAPRASH